MTKICGQTGFEINRSPGVYSNVEQIEKLGDNYVLRIQVDGPDYRFSQLRLVSPEGVVLMDADSIIPGKSSNITVHNGVLYQFVSEKNCMWNGVSYVLKRYNENLELLDTLHSSGVDEDPFLLYNNSTYEMGIQLFNDSILIFCSESHLEVYNTNQNEFGQQVQYNFFTDFPKAFALSPDSVVLYNSEGTYLATQGELNQVSIYGFDFLTRHNGTYYGITPTNGIRRMNSTFEVLNTINIGFLYFLPNICFENGNVYAVGSFPGMFAKLFTYTEELVEESELEIPETDRLYMSSFLMDDNKLYAGGTNFNSNCFKCYSFGPVVDEFQEDIGVTDITLLDSYYEELEIGNTLGYYGLYVNCDVEITNFTDHPVSNAVLYKLTNPLVIPKCSELIYLFDIPEIQPNSSVIVNTGMVFENGLYYEDDFDFSIWEEICFGTRTPNEKMDDVNGNDEFCETLEALAGNIGSQNTLSFSCYFNPVAGTLELTSDPGYSFTFLNSIGQKIYSGITQSSKTSIPVQYLSQGLFIITLEGTTNAESKKIIVC
ncbi:MAG: hypothetical protein ACKVOK_06955 [Flavobacteriales bacterium]